MTPWTAVAAPIRWPCALLVAITGWPLARGPNTAWIAAASFLSLSGVPVPWVEIRICGEPSNVTPACSQAAVMALTAPSRLGWVQWKASEDRPTPASSPRMVAPRARA